MKNWLYIFTLISCFTTANVLAISTDKQPITKVAADISISNGDLRMSKDNIVDSESVLILATVHGTGNETILGSVRFTDTTTGAQIGSDQSISLVPGRPDDVFVQWSPKSGHHIIQIQLLPWNLPSDNLGNNTATISVEVDKDTDGDGIGNMVDSDDDNDGVVDTEDLFPLDSNESADADGDGIGNNADNDDDNDDVIDKNDAFPYDSTEVADTDSDGIGNNADTDDDGDGILDNDEDSNQNGIIDDGETNPLNADTDDDGVSDNDDLFPNNPEESADTDSDGIGNNTDNDDDNDGIPDSHDIGQNNQGPIIEIGDDERSVNINNEIVIDASESIDLDGEVVNTVFIIEKLDDNYANDSRTESPKINFKERQNKINEDGTITLNSINEIIALYFDDLDGLISLETNENGEYILKYENELNEKEIYKFIGKNLKTRFTEPGNYKVTVIMQDNSNETRMKEIVIKVKDYNKIFQQFAISLVILLAILAGVKYILRAKKWGKKKK